MNILLAATGSVAAIKYWRLFSYLLDIGEVKGIFTDKAKFFTEGHRTESWGAWNKQIPNDKLSNAKIYTDINEWMWDRIGDPIVHIELKDWADILVIAPLSANTLTKMAVGICDNLLTSVYYAWPKNKNIVVAPAMNTDMWNNRLTREHISELENRHTYCRKLTEEESCHDQNKGYFNFKKTAYQKIEKGLFSSVVSINRFKVVEPVEGKLACGTTGVGAMAPLSDIVQAVKDYGS